MSQVKVFAELVFLHLHKLRSMRDSDVEEHCWRLDQFTSTILGFGYNTPVPVHGDKPILLNRAFHEVSEVIYT